MPGLKSNFEALTIRTSSILRASSVFDCRALFTSNNILLWLPCVVAFIRGLADISAIPEPVLYAWLAAVCGAVPSKCLYL